MIVEQPEAFKIWLTAVLKPMCDADPAALAKYVIALIKKDRADDELKKSMIGQLEVFLQEETESFVNLVFQTLQSQEYITTPIIPNANPPNPNIVKKEPPKDPKPIVEPAQLPNLTEQINGSVKKELEKKERDSRRTDSDKDDKPRSRIRHRSSSRNRSRSRSWERTKNRSRSPRDKRDRALPRRDNWRNKSPPAGPVSRRYERRRSRTPPARSRSRSPGRPYERRYRGPRRSTSRSRSRSPIRETGEVKRKDSKSDRERSRSRSPPPQDGTFDASGSGSSGSRSASSKRRCRDFDEKGYCMRGEMCPFDHGVDPVVLEDTTLSSVLGYNPNGTPEVPPAIPPQILAGPRHPIPMGPGVIPPEYNPQTPFLRGFTRGPRPIVSRMPMMFPPQPSINRELIPVPMVDNKQNPYSQNFPVNQPNFMQNSFDDQMFKKKPFDYNRLGPRQKNQANCSLELKKVPAGLNTITHLNNHFSKFGKIVNINLNYEGDPEAAIITFSSHAEANAAYRSTEAVLNNRFIKVFWHNVHNDVQPRAGEQTPVPPGTADVEPKQSAEQIQQNKEEARAQVTAAIKKNQELLAAKEKLKKNQSEQRKEMFKMKQDLRKRKQELLEKQLSQQKILIEKMEKLLPGPQRDLVKETIKKTQESIEEIRKDIASSTEQAAKTTTVQRKTKEDTQKEMLDIELDLITKQQEGADTTEIQKRYLELKAKNASLRAKVARGRRYNPIARHLLSKNNLIGDGAVLKTSTKIINKNTTVTPAVNFQKHHVDHRPTRILVSGYEIEEQESVLNHFTQFGEIVDYVTDLTLPSITLNYKNRKEAEIALIKGKHFQDRTLSITWCTNKQFNKQLSNTSNSKKVLISESEEEQLIDQNFLDGDDDVVIQGQELSEEVLLQDDEEEDEENEDRSWRR